VQKRQISTFRGTGVDRWGSRISRAENWSSISIRGPARRACTLESIDFNRLRAQFQNADTAILGVSADAVPAQDRFRDAHGLGFPLLSDESKTMLQAYGVWAKKHLYGRTFMGIVRTTYLIDGKGRIARVWPRVKVAGHAEEVLAAARSL